MLARYKAVIQKEFIQFFRDIPLVLLVLYIFAEVAICGWALTMDFKNVPIAVMDQDRSENSQSLVNQFVQSDRFRVIAYLEREKEIKDLLDQGEAKMIVVIPDDFSESLAVGKRTTIQLLADGENATMAGQVLGNSIELVGGYTVDLVREQIGFSILEYLPLQNLVNLYFASDLNYTHFIMITMVAIAVVLIGIFMSAAGFIREKETGTLEQLMVTPITPSQLIIAKLIPMTVIKIAGLTIGIAMSYAIFNVPIRGNLFLFYGLSLLVFISSGGMGIYIATISKTMQQALLVSFFILFPLMFLSGTLVPIENMPIFLQWLSYLSPIRYYTEISLGIFLKGVGLSSLWPQLIALVILGVLLFGMSINRLRRQLS